jgi:two-component system nitrogen regulation sensor histidine kinase NtrY
VGACVTFTLPLHSPAMNTTEAGAAAADDNPAHKEEPQLPAVVHK